jgi:hypothetical protein
VLISLLFAILLGYRMARMEAEYPWREFVRDCRRTWLLRRYNDWCESQDYDQMSLFEKLQLYRELDTIQQLQKEGKNIDDILRRRLKRAKAAKAA